MAYTRRDFSIAVLHHLGNANPHPWIVKYLVAWTQCETGSPPGANCNLLNTTEPGFGCDLLPEWNSVHVKAYPTFEDGTAATVESLTGRIIHYYPTLVECLQQNNGLPLGAVGEPAPEIMRELNTWSGDANYAATIANLANSADLRMDEEFVGRHAGQRE